MSANFKELDLGQTIRGFAAGQKLFGRYTLQRILGRGGMGIVWLARDEKLEHDVALKFLPDIIIGDRGVIEDLKRETKRCLQLTHKNIIRIHDFIQDDASACISMEYVDGDTLSNLRADKPTRVFEPDELKPWLSQLCEALDYAHNNAGIIHRDLKPSNLMINKRAELKIADFGIARSLSDSVSMLTHSSSTSGTLVYMSPQQLDGERCTPSDDIYSLGATLYELLSSKPPFYSGDISRQIHEKSPPSMMERRADLNIEGNPIPKNWENTIAACLAKDPTRRPHSIMGLGSRLAAVIGLQPTENVASPYPAPNDNPKARISKTPPGPSKLQPLSQAKKQGTHNERTPKTVRATALIALCTATMGLWIWLLNNQHTITHRVPSETDAETFEPRSAVANSSPEVTTSSSPKDFSDEIRQAIDGKLAQQHPVTKPFIGTRDAENVRANSGPSTQSSPGTGSSSPIADASVRSSKEVARCERYRATLTFPSAESLGTSDAGGAIWILKRPSDELVAKIQAGGFLPVETCLFSADGSYLAYEVGSASAGSQIYLTRIKNEGGVEDVELKLDRLTPPKLLKASLKLPSEGFFDHSYWTPVSVSPEPLAVNFDFYVDRYSAEGRPSIQINKATRFTYRIDTSHLEITGPLPKLPPLAAVTSPTPATRKLFAGRWEGAIHYGSPGGTFRLNPNAPANLAINETETRCTVTFEKTSESDSVQNYSLSRVAPNRVILHKAQAQFDGQALTVQGDTITFMKDERPALDVTTQGSFHRQK